ncbi:hypothetical protein ACF0H5_000486 [Mactra antiquata]
MSLSPGTSEVETVDREEYIRFIAGEQHLVLYQQEKLREFLWNERLRFWSNNTREGQTELSRSVDLRAQYSVDIFIVDEPMKNH